MIPEGVEREKRGERIYFKIIVEYIMNLQKETNPDPGAQGAYNKINPRWSTPRHILIKVAKVVIENFKAGRKKNPHGHKNTSYI